MKIKAKPPIPKLKVSMPSLKPAAGKTPEQADIQSAVNVYLRECGVGRFSMFKRKVLHERPWFLVIGPEGSGKSTMFSHAGIEFPVTYPSRDDGYIPHESTQPSVVWHFGHDAVWLDLPGRLFSESNGAILKDIIAALRQVRPESPVDGILLVVPCASIVDVGNDETVELATCQRKIIEQLMHTWGVELPIYLVFSRTDEIIGFNELFSDSQGRWDERLLGASIENREAQRLPRITFLEHFEIIAASLYDIRLRMLVKESDEERRSAMCRFPIDIAGMREKAALFIATLFKQGTFQERALFGGFFFISCQNNVLVPVAGSVPVDDDERLQAHPLNPRRTSKRTAPRGMEARAIPRSFFLRPLLTTVIPKQCGGINSTRNRFRRDLASLLVRCGVALLLIAAFLAVVLNSFSEVRTRIASAKALMTMPLEPSLAGLATLGSIDSLYGQLNGYASRMPPFALFITGFNVTRATRAIGLAYREKCNEMLIKPCIALLEESLNRKLDYTDESYESIKNDLRAYCILTDQRIKYPRVRNEDSLALVTLQALVVEQLIPEAARPARQKELTVILRRSCDFVREYESEKSLPVADSALVARTQMRLAELMDNRVIYSMILDDVRRSCRELGLDDIIRGTPNITALRCKAQLSEAFTPGFWREHLLQRFTAAEIQRRNSESWVTGEWLEGRNTSVDGKKQLQELVGFYLEDVGLRWRDFVSAVSVDTFPTPDDAERILRQLCAKKSPIVTLVNQFAEWAKEFSAKDSSLSIADDPFKKFSEGNGLYDEFVNDYQADYIKKLEGVANGLSEARAARSYALTFRGNETDPLVAAYGYMEAVMDPLLQDESRACLKPLLYSSLVNIREALAAPVRRELNNVWNMRVGQPFITAYAKKYPFSDVKDEASFDATCAFFHPTHGPLWNTVQEYFSYRVVERAGRWETFEKPGMVPITISPGFLSALRHARSVTNVFFDPAGAPNRWTITFTAGRHALVNAKIVIDNTTFPFGPGMSAGLEWPKKGATLTGSIHASDALGNAGLISFSGSWSMMRLINDICSYEGSNPYTPSFSVVWKINAHAKTLSLPAKVTMSGGSHPLCINVFSGFSAPEKAVE